jgi:hypothetical protein
LESVVESVSTKLDFIKLKVGDLVEAPASKKSTTTHPPNNFVRGVIWGDPFHIIPF